MPETKEARLDGADLITAERRRQVEEEGWTPEHDDQHWQGELAKAASLYAHCEDARFYQEIAPPGWPFEREAWKPKPFNPTLAERVRELAKAGALIAAEIDRLNRAAS